jgi:hypothetical protein
VQSWGKDKLVSAFGFLVVQVGKEHHSGEDESRFQLHHAFLDQNVETIAMHLKQFSLFVLYEIANHVLYNFSSLHASDKGTTRSRNSS